MSRPAFEVADIIHNAGSRFRREADLWGLTDTITDRLQNPSGEIADEVCL